MREIQGLTKLSTFLVASLNAIYLIEIIYSFPNVKNYIKSKILVVRFTISIFVERSFESLSTTLTVELAC